MTSKNNHNFKIIKLSYALLFLVGLYFVIIEHKKDLHLQMNSYHNSFFDLFFKYVTHLGDGLVFPILIIGSFFWNKKLAINLSISGVLTLLLTAFFKKIVFSGVPRPIEYIGKANLHLIDGVKMAHWNSFPSGHTTAAFAIATVLILNTNNKILRSLYFVLAVLAGLSRVYLSQHFLMDILAGSVLGIVIGYISLILFNKFKKTT